jgi:flagellar biosynthetic protein FlhB
MSGEDDDSGEKEHEASQRKLDEARRRGEVPQSQDLTGAAATAGLVLTALVWGPAALDGAGTAAAALFGQADRLAPQFALSGQAATPPLLAALAVAFGPFFAVPMLCALTAVIAQRAFVIAPEKLAPKLSRISPIAMAKQKFGRRGLFEFAKSFVKLGAISVALGWFLVLRSDRILGAVMLDPGPATAMMLQLTVEFLALVLVLQATVGAVDFVWQRADHLRQNRMTRKELTDELRESEGDPHLKAERRQRATAIATNRMLADVPTADVVIVNPTHYAVALRWDRGRPGAPVCVAKGTDLVAARIRARAVEAGVPIRSDPPTARALHAVVEIGAPVPPDQYRAVAAAIRFADAMRRKVRNRGDQPPGAR